jgi:hypothetical protein
MNWPTPPPHCAAEPRLIAAAANTIGDYMRLRDAVAGQQARHLAAVGSTLGPSKPYMAETHALWLEQRMLWREFLRLQDLRDTPAWMGGWAT